MQGQDLEGIRCSNMGMLMVQRPLRACPFPRGVNALTALLGVPRKNSMPGLLFTWNFAEA